MLCFSFLVKVVSEKENETTPCKNQNECCHVYELAFVDQDLNVFLMKWRSSETSLLAFQPTD